MDMKEKFEDHKIIGGNHYAVPTDKIREEMKDGGHLILNITVEGIRVVKKHYPESTSVYINRPSEKEHLERFKDRGTNDSEVLVRLKEDGPLEDTSEFDFVLVNETGKQEETARAILDFVNKKTI